MSTIVQGVSPASAIDDADLPAARHLTGPGARDVLGAAVAAGGGRLHSCRAVQVQYRPGLDLVVRYTARVAWGTARPVDETLLAGTTATARNERAPDVGAAFPGTLPLQAVVVVAGGEDSTLDVAVWRWPFDPMVSGLGRAVTPSALAGMLGVDPRRVGLEVVSYRPTERAVVRATTPDGVRFVKAVRPETADDVVRRHDALRAAGLPVPVVVAVDDGIVVMEGLGGESLRDQLKWGSGPWPRASAYLELGAALASSSPVGDQPRPGRVRDGIGHTRLLRAIVPDESERLDRLVEHLEEAAIRSERRRGPVVHGDLYEAQLRVEGTRIVGLLDVDDAGPGDPLDDLANVLAHLRFRAATTSDRARAARLCGYARALRRDVAASLRDAALDPAELDVVTGAAMLGLATGPFRVRQRGWEQSVRNQITSAAALIDATADGRPVDERTLLVASSSGHGRLRER